VQRGQPDARFEVDAELDQLRQTIARDTRQETERFDATSGRKRGPSAPADRRAQAVSAA